MKSPKVKNLELTSPEAALISPLNLRVLYKTPRSEMDLLPFLDLLLIGFLFFLLSSSLVFAPGISIDMPDLDASVTDSALVTDVLTVAKRGENFLFFYEGSILDLEGLHAVVDDQGKHVEEGSVLLIKMDSNLPIKVQADLVSFAKKLGYARVQLGVEVD
ncbi:MAG: biopolymer transporter ExbD [Opitutales bacterium]|nr:biopolymer transporter ExbD [Opitutales bacterium]